MVVTPRAPHAKSSILALAAAAIALAGFAAILFAQPKLTISLNTYAIEGRDVFLVPETNRVNLIPFIEGIRARDLPKAWMRLSVRPTLLVSGSQGWEPTEAPGLLVYKSAPPQIRRFTRADQPMKSGAGAEFPAFAFLPPPWRLVWSEELSDRYSDLLRARVPHFSSCQQGRQLRQISASARGAKKSEKNHRSA